jgi:hypothetical protein
MPPRLGMAAGDDYPVVVNEEGIILKTEKMVPGQLYHVIHDKKVFLFYKDENSLTHCYEVDNPDAVKEIAENPSQLESILKKYA